MYLLTMRLAPSMLAKLKKLRSRFFLDDNEFLFVNKAKRTAGTFESSVIVQMPPDYLCLCLFLVAVKQVYPDNKLLGLWPLNVVSSPRNERFKCLRTPIRHAFNWIDFSKWKRLYGSIGVRDFFSLTVGLLKGLKNWRLAHKLWCNLQSKEDVLSLELNGTPCGDLIYDTYLRFRVQSTVDISDPYLRTLIAQALNAQDATRKILSEHSVEAFLTSYSSYIQHGIPVREALRAGIKVFSSGNISQFLKPLSLEDSLHTSAHWRYKSQFESLTDREAARLAAREQLDNRFRGSIDRATQYMKTSAYAANELVMPKGVKGVVFLHDFLDSPHCYRDMLFTDFWEWAKFTLLIIEEENLPFAVKPHPNQVPESRLIVDQLKKQFPRVKWIDPKISNLSIFRSGIQCGISVFGTILHELAYQGIPALAAGDHPHVAFDIAKTPASVEEYRHCLVNFESLALPKNVQDEVLAFYYMHSMHSKEDLSLDLGQMDLRSLEQNDSIALSRFLQMVKGQRVKGVLLEGSTKGLDIEVSKLS
jgi:hypothetical protein